MVKYEIILWFTFLVYQFDWKYVIAMEKTNTNAHISTGQKNFFCFAIGNLVNTWKTRAKLVWPWHKITNYNFQHNVTRWTYSMFFSFSFVFVSVTLVTWNVCNEYIFNWKLQKKRGWLHKYTRLLCVICINTQKMRYEMEEKKTLKRSLTNLSGSNEWNGKEELTNKWQMERYFRQQMKYTSK